MNQQAPFDYFVHVTLCCTACDAVFDQRIKVVRSSLWLHPELPKGWTLAPSVHRLLCPKHEVAVTIRDKVAT